MIGEVCPGCQRILLTEGVRMDYLTRAGARRMGIFCEPCAAMRSRVCPGCKALMGAHRTECPHCRSALRPVALEDVRTCQSCGERLTPVQRQCHACAVICEP